MLGTDLQPSEATINTPNSWGISLTPPNAVRVSKYIVLLSVSDRASCSPVWPCIYCVAPDDFELLIPCLCLSSPGITAMFYRAQFIQCWGWSPGPCACLASTIDWVASQILIFFFNWQVSTKSSNNLVLLGVWFPAVPKARPGYKPTASVRTAADYHGGKTELHSPSSSGFLQSCQALFQTAAWNLISKADGTSGVLV